MSAVFPPGTRWPGRLVALGCLWAAATAHSAVFRFVSAGPITASASQTRLSRTPGGNLVCDASGVFHLIYTEWPESAVANVLVNTPDEPSRIYYTRYEAGAWSPPERVNNGYLPDQREIGGGHPSLCARPDGTVVAAWHDARHTTEAGTFIDNYEIYLDRRPPGGTWSPTDERFTHTDAGHQGDNGYSPQMALGADGRVWIAWQDFFADYNVGDIYAHASDASGQFASRPMSQMRKTVYQSGSGRGSFWQPSIAEDAAGLVHLVWTEGFAASAPLWTMTLSATGEVQSLDKFVTTGGNNLDPPRLARSPLGNLYAAWTDRRHGNGEIYLARLIGGATTFTDSRRITMDGAVSQHPDLAVDADETVHLVWSDNRDRVYNVFYCTYRFSGDQLGEAVKLTSTTGSAQHPAIKLSSRGEAMIVYEDNRSGNFELYAILGLATTGVPARAWEALR
ncbi:hypothetical protein HS125_14275 [bacterium]|nr:hypothetical protein [bacterium]